jgi:hypothetical protein
MVAQSELTDEQIAKRIGADVSALLKVKARPSFAKRVEKERRILELQKKVSAAFERSKCRHLLDF